MARIREYTQQTSVSGEVGGRRASAEDFGFGREMQNFGETMVSVGSYIKQEQERKEVDDAQIKMAEARQTWTQNYMEREKQMAPGDTSFAPTIRTEMQDYFGQMAEGYTTQAAKKYVKMHGTTMTTGFFAQGLQYQSAMAGRKAIEDVGNRKAADANTVYMNPQLYDMVKGSYQFDSQNNVGTAFSILKNDPRKETLDRDYLENIAKNAGKGWLKNPANRGFLVGSIQGGESVTSQNTFQSVIPSIFKREGGYVAEDGKRGATKFGINGQANGLTSDQVKGLTEDQAAQIYKNNYWDKYGLDSVAPAAIPVVFDGVVNHRAEFAQQLVNAAKNGATPEQLADMRKSEYTRLIQADPAAFSKYEKSWMNRVDASLTEAGTVTQQQEQPLSVDESKLPAWYADMSPEAKDQFLREAMTIHRQERAVADQALARTVKDHEAELAMYGGKLKSPMLPEAAFGGDRLKWQAYNSMVKAGEEVQNIANAPEGMQAAMLKKLEPQQSEVPGVFSYQHELYRNAVKLLDQSNKLRREDPISFATSTGFSNDNPIQPIQTADPQKLSESLIVRDPQATAIAKSYNQEYKLLTKGEAGFLRQSFDQMDTRQQAEWIGTVRGALPPEKFRAMINQMANGDKALMAAGIVASSQYGGDTRDMDAENIIVGRNAMTRHLKGGGNEQERGFKAAGLPNAGDAYRLTAKQMEGLLGVPEAQKEAMVEAAMAHYIGASIRKNSFAVMDLSGPDSTANQIEFKKSVEAILPVSKIGAYSILRPYGMPDDQFQERMDMTVRTKFGKERGTYSVMMTGGKYQLVLGGVATGEPFDLQSYGAYSNEGRGIPKPYEQMSFEEKAASKGGGFYTQANKDLGKMFSMNWQGVVNQQ
jgi:lysozyme family protein